MNETKQGFYGVVDNSPSPIDYEGEFKVGSTFSHPDPMTGHSLLFAVEDISSEVGKAFSGNLGVCISKVNGKWCNNRMFFERNKERRLTELLV